MTEEQTVRLAQDGDLGAFESLVRAFYPRLLSFASRRVPDFDAEEVVQETFLKAFGGMRALRIPARFGSWLYAICRNEIINSIRLAGACGDDGIEDIPGLGGTGTDSPAATGNEELLQAVAELGDRHKDVIRMRYFDGLSLGRIASILGLREALVKSRLHEAREVLRRSLPSTTEATQGTFALIPLLKEAIMKSVELTKNAASVLARLSLEDQMGICDAAVERRRFDSRLVEVIARLEGGMELLQGCDSHLDERELAAVLNFSDEGVRTRCLEAAEKRYQSAVGSLRRTMVLPELNVQDEGLQLRSETIDGCGNCIIVALAGYIDSHNVQCFMQRTSALISGGYTRLILDCAGLNYISSAGVGAMTTLRNALERVGGDICILAMQPPVRGVFTFLCIAPFFVFHDDRAAALQWARQQRVTASCFPEGGGFRETFRYLCQLDTSRDGAPLQTRKVEDSALLCFGYAGIPRGMAGDYLGLRRLGEHHVGAIVSEASGRGEETTQAMVNVAALFQSFVAGWRATETPASLERLAYAINEALYRESRPATFCALQALVLDGRSGELALVHAGTPFLRVFDPDRGQLCVRDLPSAPSAGSFSSKLVREKTGFGVQQLTLRPGESLFLCTDGLEESRRYLRGVDLEPIPLGQGPPKSEPFGFERMAAVVAAALTKGSYELRREECGGATRTDRFDFSRRDGTVQDAILALAAVEEVFRLTPFSSGARLDAKHGPGVAVLPPQVDQLLAECLEGYPGVFSRRVRSLSDAAHYGGLLQDPPCDDDLVLLGIGRKQVAGAA